MVYDMLFPLYTMDYLRFSNIFFLLFIVAVFYAGLIIYLICFLLLYI